MSNALEQAKAMQARAQGGGQGDALSRAKSMQKAAAAKAATPEVPEGYFPNTQTGQMTSRDLLTNQAKVEQGMGSAAALGYLQGSTLGFSDEILGGVGALTHGEEHGNYVREAIRAKQDAAADEFPTTTVASEIVGAVANPALRAIPQAQSIKGAAATGAALAGAEGFGRGEGGIANRAENAAKSAATGLLFAGATAGTIRAGSKGFQKAFNASVKRPTVGNLQGVKNAAYKAVDEAGETFEPLDMQRLFSKTKAVLDAEDFDDIADPQTAAALRFLERRQGETVSLRKLDKMRQNVWKRYSRSNEPLLLEVVGQIDEAIDARAPASELMSAARAANSRYKKAEMLEDAFDKARLQTSATGSGGNILNKYRQAITSIVTSPQKSKWFEAEELKLMEGFIEGDTMENTLRRVGKLAPGGNGLMTALNVYGATVNPSLLAITGAASAAKGAADRKAIAGSEALLDTVSGFKRAAQQALPDDTSLISGALAGSLQR